MKMRGKKGKGKGKINTPLKNRITGGGKGRY